MAGHDVQRDRRLLRGYVLTGFLLDTHSLVWAIDTPEMLSEPARLAIEQGPIYLSVASLWELIIKRKEKLPFSRTLWTGGIATFPRTQ